MNQEETADEDLMLAYRDGHAHAFEKLYLRHKTALYRFILRQCGNESTAEELFQDVWASLIKARARYSVSAKFTTWLYQIARNRLIDHYRKQTSRSTGSHDSDNIESLAARQQEQPENQVEINDKTLRLIKLVEDLPEAQKQAFLLREEAGMSVHEIAELTGVSPETAKSRLRYAVRKLRVELDD